MGRAPQLLVLVAPGEDDLAHGLGDVVRGLPHAVLVRLDACPVSGAQVGVAAAAVTGQLAHVVWFGPGLSTLDGEHLAGWVRSGAPPAEVPTSLVPHLRLP